MFSLLKTRCVALSVVVLAASVALDALADDAKPTGADVGFTNLVLRSVPKVPRCLSRFLDYPPGRGVLGFPRCLFESPFKANPDFWLKGMDFTCVSPWNDSYGRFRAGTAISRRHVIFVKHFPVANGTRIAFVGENGDVSHYTIKATKSLDVTDIQIGLLDYELTPDVRPARILPENGEAFFAEGSKWPAVTFDQNERVYLSELTNQKVVWAKGLYLHNGESSSADWKKLGGRLISGDSGNPAFMVYRGQPIFLYCLRGGGAGLGPMVHRFREHVQRAMDELCPGYKLEEFDFGCVAAP